MFDIKTELTNHAKGGSSLGKAVADYIDSYGDTMSHGEGWQGDCAKAICLIMANWRQDAAELVEAGEIDNKAANNSSNYVGAVCRKMLGYTIKVVKRKPEYVYECSPVEQKTDTEEAPASDGGDSDDEIPFAADDSEPTTREMIQRIIDERGFDDVAAAFRELLEDYR